MVFSQTAEYALRAMARLATLPPGTSVRARDLSLTTGIPADYVSKVLRRMVRAGLLDSQKGHGGGFRLVRPASEILFLDILRAMDEPIDSDRCVYGQGACGSSEPCLLHGAFAPLKAAIHEWASTTTLAAVGSQAHPLPQFHQPDGP